MKEIYWPWIAGCVFVFSGLALGYAIEIPTSLTIGGVIARYGLTGWYIAILAPFAAIVCWIDWARMMLTRKPQASQENKQ